MQTLEEFPYPKGADSKKTRAIVTVFLFLGAALFLWWGERASLAEPNALRLSSEQNLAVNALCAFVLSVFGLLNLFSLWKTGPDHPTSVLISADRITAPNQGVLARPIEIRFSDITQLKKLSVDGVWEFNVNSRDKHIRIAKGALNDPADFDRMAACLQQRVTSCELQIEQRINPPEITP